MEPSAAPSLADPFRCALRIYLEIVDADGAPRNFNMCTYVQADPQGGGTVVGVFPIKKLWYRSHYRLTGEYGVRVTLAYPIAVADGIHLVTLAESRELLPAEVATCVMGVLEGDEGASRVVRDGFVHFAPFGSEESITFELTLAVVSRQVCLQAAVVTMPTAVAQHVVERARVYQQQVGLRA